MRHSLTFSSFKIRVFFLYSYVKLFAMNLNVLIAIHNVFLFECAKIVCIVAENGVYLYDDTVNEHFCVQMLCLNCVYMYKDCVSTVPVYIGCV